MASPPHGVGNSSGTPQSPSPPCWDAPRFFCIALWISTCISPPMRLCFTYSAPWPPRDPPRLPRNRAARRAWHRAAEVIRPLLKLETGQSRGYHRARGLSSMRNPFCQPLCPFLDSRLWPALFLAIALVPALCAQSEPVRVIAFGAHPDDCD